MGKKKKGSAGGNSNANKAAGTKEEASEMKAVTLEFNCLCGGCLSRIKKGSYRATLAGHPELSVEQSKSRVTVKGKLAVEAEYLAELVKTELGGRSVAVVPPPPPKKEGDGGEADKKNKGGDDDNKGQAKGDPPQTGYTRDGGVYWYGYPAENIRPQPFYHPGWGCPCGCSYPQICQCGYNPQMFSYSWLGCGGY